METADPDDDRTIVHLASAPAAAADAAPRPSSEGHNSLPVGTMLGEFEILRTLGEGGFGIVYLATDHSLKRRVALKEYMPTSLAHRRGALQVHVTSERHRETFEIGLKSFINEARVLAQFDHPSLVKVHRFWEANGTAYMVMSFHDGVTLRDHLFDVGRSPDEAWLMGLLAPLTEALMVLHADQCFHRDIAPDNIILLAGSGRPLLLDFGAARQVIGDRTQALTAILKPGYAPIEQYAETPGMRQGPWTDVYALAAMVYYAATGEIPPASVARLIDDSYVPLEERAAGRYSLRFLRAIDHALWVRPDGRTQSMAELRQELGIDTAASADAHRPATTLPPAPPPIAPTKWKTQPPAPPPTTTHDVTPAPSRGGKGLWIGVGAVAVAAAVGGAVLVLKPAPKPDAPTVAAKPDVPPPANKIIVEAPPPPAPPPPAQPPPAEVPFSIAREFDRVLKAQSPGFTVDSAPAKSQLKIGRDRLSFSVTSARAGHVYVLWNDADGALYLMFPNKASSNNRIRAGQTLNLPEASWRLDTTKPAGAARMLVMVSDSPRDFSTFGKNYDYLFQRLPNGEAAAALARSFTGVGSVLAGRAECSGQGCDAYGATQFAVDVLP